jgi:4-amino-4-deoxy-L-arabinose transferase-like glycosyltransferase
MLVALSLLVAYRLMHGPSLLWAGLLGVLIGLASLTRGEVFLLLLLLLIPLVRRPRGVAVAAVSIVAMLLVLTPWTIRNYSTFDRFVFVSTNSGAVIGGANCAPTYAGSNIGGWDILCDRPWPGHNEAEETNRQFHDGARYAKAHVRRWPIVVAARVARTVSLFHPWETNSGRDPGVQNAGVVMYFLLVPLGLYGAVLLRRRRATLWPLLAPVVMVIVTAALFYGFLRFRQPAEISLVVLAGVALDGLAARLGARPSDAPVTVPA